MWWQWRGVGPWELFVPQPQPPTAQGFPPIQRKYFLQSKERISQVLLQSISTKHTQKVSSLHSGDFLLNAQNNSNWMMITGFDDFGDQITGDWRGMGLNRANDIWPISTRYKHKAKFWLIQHVQCTIIRIVYISMIWFIENNKSQ